jgi:AmiR/NasT family two-component response regulator
VPGLDVGAWAPGIVAIVDLSFSTKLDAAQAAVRLEVVHEVDVATGFLAEAQRVTTDEASARLKQAAARSGTTELQVARTILAVLRPT